METNELSQKVITELGFHPNPSGIFENIQMPYYVRKGVCLFYNEGQENVYYAGFAEMRQGKYYSVQIKWIEKVYQLKEFYFALTDQELTIKS